MDQYSERVNMMVLSSQMEKVFEWRKWSEQIPRLKFKPEWEVQIIPPIVAAVVRFAVYKEKKRVSVYLDCYENLGYFGGPHWEIYPSKDGDNARFAMEDTEGLLNAIDESLNDG